jgi:RNA polymerase sigma factor (sigma-70 family)
VTKKRLDVMRAVQRLPARPRTAVVLRYVADLTEAEVAEAMGVAPGTVAATLSNARRRLAVLLADYSPTEEMPRG